MITAISLSLFPSYSYKLQGGGEAFLESEAVMQHKGGSTMLEDEHLSLAFSLQGLSGTVGHHIINSKCQLILSQFPSSLELQSVVKCWRLHAY